MKRNPTIVVLAALVLLVPVLVGAQGPIPPVQPDPHPSRDDHDVDREIKAIARDYIDLLQQLADLIRDYTESCNTVLLGEDSVDMESLELLAQRLAEGKYRVDIKTLEKDLEVLAVELHNRWAEERAVAMEKRARAAARCMQQEVSVLLELLEEDVIKELASESKKSEIVETYLKHVFEHGDHEGELLGTVDIALRDVETAVPDVPKEPQPPAPPRVTDRRKGSRGQITIARTLVDSSLGITSGTEIYIVAPIGQVEIEGWSRDKVIARLEVELATKDGDKARSMSDEISVGLDTNHNKLRIEPRLPSMSDLSTNIVYSTLSVKMPKTSPLICETSFSELKVGDLDNGLRIKAHKSTVIVDEIRGDVELVGNLCEISASGSAGALTVSNALGTIEVDDWSGNIMLGNQLAPVILKDSKGDAKIKSNGDITVEDFDGDLLIRNSNGIVDVSDVDGDLTIHTSFKPVFIEDVSGAVDLSNTNADITAISVAGPLKVHNRSGDITGEDLTGPLDLKADGGDVAVSLGRLRAERSTIEAFSGTITLSVSPRSDLHLVAETWDGAIINLYDGTAAPTQGRTKYFELSLGKARYALNVTGKHADITVERER